MKKTIYLLFVFLSFFSLEAEEETNAIIVCENSVDMLEWDLKFIKQATQSIECSLCFTGGTVFRRLMSAVEERIKDCSKIQVYFLIAPVLLEERERIMIEYFKHAYPENFHLQVTDNIFNYAPTYTAADNHVKTIIVDEKYYSLGGTNFDEALCVEGTKKPSRRPGEGVARNSLPGGMRDEDIVGRGPLAKELRLIFHNLYALWEHFSKTNHFISDPLAFQDKNYYRPIDETQKPIVTEFENSKDLTETPHIKLFLSGACLGDCNCITAEYARLIDLAKEEIVIGNLFIVPAEPIDRALKNALKRGVDFSLITNGVFDEGPLFCNFIGWGNRMNYVPLFYGSDFHFWEKERAQATPLLKTRIWEYRVPDVIYHKKVMIIDKRYSVIGSYNLGYRSDLSDYEIIAVIDSPKVAADFLKVFERDKEFSKPISPEEACEWYFDVTMHYLGQIQKLFSGFL